MMDLQQNMFEMTTPFRPLRVLVACEESQAVCKAFRALGHEAFSCDIQPCSGGHPEWHIQDDVMNHINDGWDLMIAHPPCTYISNAGARWLYAGHELNQVRYKQGEGGVVFFMALYNAPITYIAVENPHPSVVFQKLLPQPSTIIEPYHFGHPFSKATYLWLKNLPPLMPTEIMATWKPLLPSNAGGAARGQKHYNGSVRGSKNYAKTFDGVAAAMADQWSKYILNDLIAPNGQEGNHEQRKGA